MLNSGASPRMSQSLSTLPIRVSVTLDQLKSLFFYGIEVCPNAYEWVDDASIQLKLDEGYREDTTIPHTPATNRAGRIASYVRMIDEGTLPRFAEADLAFRNVRLRLSFRDGNHRLRAMQFRKDRESVEILIHGDSAGVWELREALPSHSFLGYTTAPISAFELSTVY